MIYHNAYCSKEFLDHVIDSKDGKLENDIVLRLISDHCNIIFDIDDAELDALVEENDVYRSFIRREAGGFKGDSSYFSYLTDFDSVEFYVNHFNDYIFLDKDFLKLKNKIL